MIVVPIARDRCFFYRKFLFTLDRSRLLPSFFAGLAHDVVSIIGGHPLDELLNPVN
jgi:hypothetical protein